MICPIKSHQNYICNICYYNTCNNKDYKKHLLTLKHQNRVILNKTEQEIPKKSISILKCECGKEYSARNSLWYHKKKCSIAQGDNNEKNNIITSDFENSNTDNLIKMLLKNQHVMENIILKNQDVMEKMIEIMPKISNQTTCNTTNTVNNHFSINVFLNDQCKDAMNLTEFVRNIQCQVEDLENIGRIGYVDGISKIFIDNLSNLAITKRPLHCTDVKRKSMYVKKDNEWKKDDKHEEVRKAITQVANKNIQNIEGWRVKNMDQTGNSVTGGTAKRQQYLDIVGESLEPDEDGKKSEKILKNVGEAVLLDKNVIDLCCENGRLK